MSEEKKASEKILERLNLVEANLKTLIEANKPPQLEVATETSKTEKETSQEKQGHDSVESMLSCPDCGKKAREQILAPLHGQTIVKCKKCGTHVGKDEEKCPSCGSSEAE